MAGTVVAVWLCPFHVSLILTTHRERLSHS